ncbi:MAG: GNAT family N-acetyltransferase [Caldilineaceae bacterium]|nr:GNAT family N-acetyltransferase [Caldilineaceae bacterium]
MFKFLDPGLLVDDELILQLVERDLGDPVREIAPSYRFKMTRLDRAVEMGRIDLRIGQMHNLLMYGGHIGYRVHSAYRGHHFAARAVQLLIPLARAHALGTLWITCNPDNWASRRSCELAGLELVEIVDIPPHIDMYYHGERQKCRYRLVL